MELNEALAKLAELEKKLYAYQAADSALYLDGTTAASLVSMAYSIYSSAGIRVSWA